MKQLLVKGVNRLQEKIISFERKELQLNDFVDHDDDLCASGMKEVFELDLNIESYEVEGEASNLESSWFSSWHSYD